MEVNNSTITPSSLVNILTLRYDPNLQAHLPKKSWVDFESTIFNSINIDMIENSICNNFEQGLKNITDSNSISIALSGGVDSTLVLSLIR